VKNYGISAEKNAKNHFSVVEQRNSKKKWVLFFDVTHRAMFFMRLPNTKFARAQLLSAVWT
jgi:hypothetical protein